MSWLNNSLSTIKGQLTTLAQEVLAETAGPSDEHYRAPPDETKTAVELLATTQKENDELHRVCSEQEGKIALLNKQIVELQSKVIAPGSGGGTGTRQTSKSSSDDAGALEDSWCWEPDNAKTDNDRSSDSSCGNGAEMVNITLDEVPVAASGKAAKGRQSTVGNVTQLQQRVRELTEQNEQLNTSLEELDSQHNVAMQNVLELKADLQQKLNAITKVYESLKKEHADKFINSELEMARLKKQIDSLERERKQADMSQQQMQTEIERYSEELRTSMVELADLQALLHKRDEDSVELIERIKAADQTVSQMQEERDELAQKLERLQHELDEVKKSKGTKTTESVSSKHSEDEFIVVRDGDGEGDGDASSSGPTTPPTKEELRDKIVALENRLSELTIANGSLSLQLQDREMEKQLATSVLKENMQALQQKCDEQDAQLQMAAEERREQLERLAELKERAAEGLIAQQQLKSLSEAKQKIEAENEAFKKTADSIVELEKRLLISEQEKEQLQLELQSLRTQHERMNELETKVQALTLENQQFKLNTEADTEVLNNSAELEEKLRHLSHENEAMRLELESIAQEKFRRAIAEAKQEITDLDDDDDAVGDESVCTVEQLRQLLQAITANEVSETDRESVEKTYRALRDRLSRVNEWERSMAQLSEELIDMKNGKLMWEHEKKTLEADISQYILQCDELMKNNEILLNELENLKRNKLEPIPEHNEENLLHLETQLEECSRLNHTLESEYAELSEKLEALDREKQELTEKLRGTQRRNEQLENRQREQSMQIETLELEKSNLLFEINEVRSTESRDDPAESVADIRTALQAAEQKCVDLESQLARLGGDHADLVVSLQDQKNSLGEAIKRREEVEVQLAQQEDMVKRLTRELETLKAEDRCSKETVKLKQELLAKDQVTEALKQELSELRQTKLVLEQQLLEMQNTMVNVEEMLNQEKGSGESLRAEMETLINEQENLVESKKLEEAHKLNEQLKLQLKELSDQLETLRTSTVTHDTDEKARIVELEMRLAATADLQKSVDVLAYEKNEMIKALQQKHAENTQYYAEIQRLQGLVIQLQEESRQLTAQNEGAIGQLHREREKLQDQITFLKEKSDILTTNLVTEQTNQKLIAQEKADTEAQNAAIRKDLERLRAHLLEIEEMHTKETMEMQRELDETKARMVSLQEEVSKSSTAYTSASIRANQHAETLQAQYALVVQQRDELVAKLSLAEDRDSKNQAALCNLQCALEQFQNGRENDIQAATQRIRRELQQQLDKEAQLQQELNMLTQKLSDANLGLKAASRLSDQLESAQQTIAALREEVDGLKQQNSALEAKLSASESSQSDKIEKNLIKSLLIGYVVSSNPNDKQQVLRMISSVLGFTANESDRCGLNKQQSRWFSSIIGGQQETSNSNENLITAFVQFLEQESQPTKMPNLLNIVPTPQSSSGSGAESSTATEATRRRSSVVSDSGAVGSPLPVQPLVLNTDVYSEFAPTRNSSSILKDILNDS